MKTKLLSVAGAMMLLSMTATSQTTSSFDELKLPIDSFWNGSTQTLGTTFQDGNAIFPNYYDTSYGGFWTSGWAYSNKQDSVTTGTANLYSARTGIGYDGSDNYVIGQQNAVVRLTGKAKGRVVDGCYITNGTYAYFSMKNGDKFAKKFGGKNGDDADWFKLVIRKWYNGSMGTDSMEFYLADYTFDENENDYIVKSWEWVNLSSLGNADSLLFTLSSSDVGQFGMNTPAFFCMDNFITSDTPLGTTDLSTSHHSLSLYPNPTSELLKINLSEVKYNYSTLTILTPEGQVVFSETINTHKLISVDVSQFAKGIYFLQLEGKEVSFHQKFLKQ